MESWRAFLPVVLGTVGVTGAWAAPELDVVETGQAPDRSVAIIAPDLFRAVIRQASGGGIAEFYNLAVDPGAKTNLAGPDRGLFEIGWHGATFKRAADADGKTCCIKHKLEGDDGKDCYDGCRDWPSMGHQALKAQGELAVIEKSPARVRVQARSWFTWWSKYVDEDLPVTAVYTFYPDGQIAIQVRVRRTGTVPMHWSGEYGPHLMVPGDSKDAQADLGFVWSFPERGAVGLEDEQVPARSEALVLAASVKARTALMLTIPSEEGALFARHMRHDGRSIGWDRCGYGSGNVVMQPGYDSTWACLIRLCTPGSKIAPYPKTAKDALTYGEDYRRPARIAGAMLVTRDPGDLNGDGFNESEGCHVLEGPGPLAFMFEKGNGAGLAPAFKVLGWPGITPRSVTVNGEEVPFAAGVIQGTLILQVQGALPGEKARIGIR